MIDKLVFVITIACLGLFGLRSFLPAIPSSALVGLFTIAGLIGCYYYLGYSRSKRSPDALSMAEGWLIG